MPGLVFRALSSVRRSSIQGSVSSVWYDSQVSSPCAHQTSTSPGHPAVWLSRTSPHRTAEIGANQRRRASARNLGADDDEEAADRLSSAPAALDIEPKMDPPPQEVARNRTIRENPTFCYVKATFWPPQCNFRHVSYLLARSRGLASLPWPTERSVEEGSGERNVGRVSGSPGLQDVEPNAATFRRMR